MPAPILIGRKNGWMVFQHIDFVEEDIIDNSLSIDEEAPVIRASESTPIMGKYLFFSESFELLVGVAICEIADHGFMVAKISMEAQGGDHVLCLYWTDDGRGRELALRHSRKKYLKYRWWKSNADTKAGKYSDQFKRTRSRQETRTKAFISERDLDPNEQPDDISELPSGEDADFGDSLDLGCKD